LLESQQLTPGTPKKLFTGDIHMETNEKLLDDMFTLSLKRTEKIQNSGQDFTLEGTEKTVKGLLSADQKTVDFLPGARICFGYVYQAKNTRFFILGSTQRAGMVTAEVAAISGTATTMKRVTTASGDTIAPEGMEVPIFSTSGNEITAPRYAASFTGKILKIGGSLREVVGTRINGPVAILSTREFILEQPKMAPRPAKEAPYTVSFSDQQRTLSFSDGW
jgi:hypothetical protein